MTHSKSIHLGDLLRAVLTATLGGLLFGYDTAVIAGTIEFLQTHFDLTDLALGWTVSSALLGCMIGAAFAGWLSDRFGRKRTMVVCAVLFFASAIWSGMAQSPGELVLARILGGLGVGAASLLTPIYIAEIAPSRIRGGLITLNQIAILVGMIVVYFVNAQLAVTGDDAWRVSTAWRWMFASEGIPALLFLLMLFAIPESPRWLVLKGKLEEAKAILERVGGDHDIDQKLSEIKASHHEDAQPAWRTLLQLPQRTVLVVGITIAILQQATGINIVMYYAPRIFTSAGLDTSSAIGHSVLIGLAMLFFTLIALVLTDRIGRKPLLMFSAITMTVSLAALGFTFVEGDASNATLLLILVITYVAAFSIGMGPLGWVVIAEIFPNEMRGRAVGLCVLMLWLTNFIVSQTFPELLSRFAENSFFIYTVFGAFSIYFFARHVKETRGRTLEEIESGQ